MSDADNQQLDSKQAAKNAANVASLLIKPKYSPLQRAQIIQGNPVAILRGDEAPQGNLSIRRQWARELFTSLGSKAHSPELGDIVLNRSSVNDSLGHGQSHIKTCAFSVIKDVIEKGAVIASSSNKLMNSYFICAPIIMMNEPTIMTVLVRQDVNAQKMYLHRLDITKNLLNQSHTATNQEEQHRSNNHDLRDQEIVQNNDNKNNQLCQSDFLHEFHIQGKAIFNDDIAPRIKALLALDLTQVEGQIQAQDLNQQTSSTKPVIRFKHSAEQNNQLANHQDKRNEGNEISETNNTNKSAKIEKIRLQIEPLEKVGEFGKSAIEVQDRIYLVVTEAHHEFDALNILTQKLENAGYQSQMHYAYDQLNNCFFVHKDVNPKLYDAYNADNIREYLNAKLKANPKLFQQQAETFQELRKVQDLNDQITDYLEYKASYNKLFNEFISAKPLRVDADKQADISNSNNINELNNPQQAKSTSTAAKSFAKGKNYLEAKKINPTLGTRINDRNGLIIPIYDVKGKLHTIQTIYQKADGSSGKYLAKGGKKGGYFHPIGGIEHFQSNIKAAKAVFIAEGYATAVSIYEAFADASTNLQHNILVIAAIDASNLRKVALNIREFAPKTAIIIAADNDKQHNQDGTLERDPDSRPLMNIGVIKAKQAAKAANDFSREYLTLIRPLVDNETAKAYQQAKAIVMIPEYPQQANKPYDKLDFNDLANYDALNPTNGKQEVKQQIKQALRRLGPQFVKDLQQLAGLANSSNLSSNNIHNQHNEQNNQSQHTAIETSATRAEKTETNYHAKQAAKLHGNEHQIEQEPTTQTNNLTTNLTTAARQQNKQQDKVNYQTQQNTHHNRPTVRYKLSDADTSKDKSITQTDNTNKSANLNDLANNQVLPTTEQLIDTALNTQIITAHNFQEARNLAKRLA